MSLTLPLLLCCNDVILRMMIQLMVLPFREKFMTERFNLLGTKFYKILFPKLCPGKISAQLDLRLQLNFGLSFYPKHCCQGQSTGLNEHGLAEANQINSGNIEQHLWCSLFNWFKQELNILLQGPASLYTSKWILFLSCSLILSKLLLHRPVVWRKMSTVVRTQHHRLGQTRRLSIGSFRVNKSPSQLKHSTG